LSRCRGVAAVAAGGISARQGRYYNGLAGAAVADRLRGRSRQRALSDRRRPAPGQCLGGALEPAAGARSDRRAAALSRIAAGGARLSESLYRACNAWLGHRRGGLALATIGGCGAFAAICGSSLATAATMAQIALPEMRRYGYDDRLATGSVAAGGTIGILIPP